MKPNSRMARVEERDGRITVWVKAPAQRGMANSEAVELLARYFNVPKTHVRILRGFKGREKLVEVVF